MVIGKCLICAVFFNGPFLTDVFLVLNRLYKTAPTACATFEWVWGRRQTRHDVTDQRKHTLNQCF